MIDAKWFEVTNCDLKRFPMTKALTRVSLERIAEVIYLIRGERVILDRDLAALYEVQTKALNQAVRRNLDRFPPDFMFQLTRKEFDSLRSQIVISKGRGGAAIFHSLSPSTARLWPQTF